MTSIGKIVTANTNLAYCEFSGPQVEEGSLLYYRDGDTKVPVKVTSLQASPRGGTVGNIVIEQVIGKPPVSGVDLFMDPDAQQGLGVRLKLAYAKDQTLVPIRLNALFRHALLGGTTQSGKTHGGIALAEELDALQVPLLLLDLQNEFTGLKEISKNVVILESADPSKALRHLKDRKTVVVPFLGLGDAEKCRSSAEILQFIFDAKETDHAKGKPTLPPILIMADEAEVLAPGDKYQANEEQRTSRAIIEKILKRGSKLGLGMILLVQRLPMLYVEVRSQCNSMLLFLLDDMGSISQLRLKGLTKYEQGLLARLVQGECVIRGPIVPRSTVVRIRPIRAPRTKNVNFEALLGLEEGVAVK